MVSALRDMEGAPGLDHSGPRIGGLSGESTPTRGYPIEPDLADCTFDDQPRLGSGLKFRR